jgi:hypothetical protein
MMPNLAPIVPIPKLKNNWFRVCSNPEDPNDKNLCIQIIDGPFHHVIIKYKNFSLKEELNNDGSVDCDYEYDIVMAPGTIGERDITDEEGEIFEKNLGKAIIELLWEQAKKHENRISDTNKSSAE